MSRIPPLLFLPFRAVRYIAFASLVMSAWAFTPYFIDAVRLFGIRDDPTAMLERAAESRSPDEIRRLAEQALAENDPELAESLSVVAADNGEPLPSELLAKIEESNKFSLARSAFEVWTGISTGRGDTPTAFVAAAATDALIVGDLRDLATEAAKYPDYDRLTVFLAGIGVAASASNYVSLGAAAPLRGGLSILKKLKKLNKLPEPLEKDVVALASRSIDDGVIRAMKHRASDLDLNGALQEGRKLIKPEAVKMVSDAARATFTVSSKQGYRATVQTVENAGELADLKRLAAVAEKTGQKYRGVLALRKGAKIVFTIVEYLAEVVWILIGVVVWILLALWTLLRFVRSVANIPMWFSRRSAL
ncbi:hypothetical protein [Rhizobium sp. BG4]|uniref:hypothetical protein n=1 Tax=Rhizobium sp. BG4 TaxID=2613770 RepID=UPI00193E07EC|nr:hypothetical protein [Rhizobium sp. BG4]QRM47220.1 hypothetical protein F2982_27985 [Rhizobium sp. BG4]